MKIIQRSNLSNPTASNDDDEIPDWLLFEILLRLPLNSVYQYRVVSKRWLCVASDPYFVRSYASRAASSFSSPWIVLPQSVYQEENRVPAFVHNPSNNNVIPHQLYPRPPLHNSYTREGYSIIGVSDGLVLYSYPTTRTLDDTFLFDFRVCNPITGHQTEPVTLPVPFYADRGWGFLTRIDDRDFTLKSYRIVHARDKRDDGVIAMYVYCSEVGEWDEFEVARPENCPFSLQQSAAVLDGILYWAGATGGVVAYDPEASPPDQVRFIRDPHDSERMFDMYYSCACVGYRGELRYFGGCPRGRDEIPRFNIWKLEDDLGEWSLLHKIENTPQISRALRDRNRRTFDRMDVLCFDPFDSDVVYLFDKYGPYVFSCHMKSGTIDDYHEMIVDRVSSSYEFPWSLVLVLPPWPTHVAEKQLERH